MLSIKLPNTSNIDVYIVIALCTLETMDLRINVTKLANDSSDCVTYNASSADVQRRKRDLECFNHHGRGQI